MKNLKATVRVNTSAPAAAPMPAMETVDRPLSVNDNGDAEGRDAALLVEALEAGLSMSTTHLETH